MNTLTTQIGQSRLMLHTGGKTATLDQIDAVATPKPTKTWVPIPHRQVIDEVITTLGRTGLGVKETAFALYGEGQRFFGLLGMDIKGGDGEYQLVIGLRNSHDKSFPVGLVVGSRVFVCDNLAFSSEIQVTRRHTSRLMDDLPRLITTACGRIHQSAETQERRFLHYKDCPLRDEQAHDLLVQALDVGAIGSTALPKVLDQWREPKHADFSPRNAWSLWNGFTEVFKDYSTETVSNRSIALQGLLDVYTRFPLASPNNAKLTIDGHVVKA